MAARKKSTRKKSTRKKSAKRATPKAKPPAKPDPFDLDDEGEKPTMSSEEPRNAEPPHNPEDDDLEDDDLETDEDGDEDGDDDPGNFPEDMGEPLKPAKLAKPAPEKPKPEKKRGPVPELLVRIRPYNPKRGQTMRSFGYKSIRFRIEQGWYRVARAIGEHLATVRCSDMDPESQLAFDVCTEAEARRIIEAEVSEGERGTPARPLLP